MRLQSEEKQENGKCLRNTVTVPASYFRCLGICIRINSESAALERLFTLLVKNCLNGSQSALTPFLCSPSVATVSSVRGFLCELGVRIENL